MAGGRGQLRPDEVEKLPEVGVVPTFVRRMIGEEARLMDNRGDAGRPADRRHEGLRHFRVAGLVGTDAERIVSHLGGQAGQQAGQQGVVRLSRYW